MFFVILFLLNLYLHISQNAVVTLRAHSVPCVRPAGVSVSVDPTLLVGTVTIVPQLRSCSALLAADVSSGEDCHFIPSLMDFLIFFKDYTHDNIVSFNTSLRL